MNLPLIIDETASADIEYQNNINYYSGFGLFELFSDYSQQKRTGTISTSTDDNPFPENMRFKEWLSIQVRCSIYANFRDL